VNPSLDLIEQNHKLAEQNHKLTEQNRELLEENRQLKEIIASQAEQIRLLFIRLDELTHEVAFLKEENQKLRDELAVYKGQKPKPKIPPSKLEGPQSKDKKKQKGSKASRSKRSRNKKKVLLEIHQEQIIQPLTIPEGAIFKGYKSYAVQDVVWKPNNTRYLLARWKLPDGSYISGELPKGIHGHYGPELIAYILNDYHACRVTEPLLLNKLRQKGVLMSSGQLNNILIQGKDLFHLEKSELLPAGIKACNQIKTDDTSARHQGKNQYTNVIGNEWFTLFTTTDSKSRANFFKVLQNGKHEYLINEDTLAYLIGVKAADYLPGYLALSKGKKFTSKIEWEEFLRNRDITSNSEVRCVTEAAHFASLIENGIPRDLGVHGDDAGQFDAFIRSLCWIHEERHYRKIIPIGEQARIDLDQVRDEIWTIYRNLKIYQEAPTEATRKEIEKQFDDIFLNRETSSPTLTKRLRMTYSKKQELLRVLERPDTPLHNNSSETDARSAVTKRKVSGGTRSDAGKEARDTFLSLKQTCRKLGINFIAYLKDRVSGLFEIPKLAEIIHQKSQAIKISG
jgi:hypothetical protein